MGLDSSAFQRIRGSTLILLIEVLVIFIVAAAILDHLGIIPDPILNIATRAFGIIIGILSSVVGGEVTDLTIRFFDFVLGLIILLFELAVASIVLVGVIWGVSFYWKYRKDALRDVFRAELKHIYQPDRRGYEEQQDIVWEITHFPIYYRNIDNLHRLSSEERTKIVEYYTKILNGSISNRGENSHSVEKERQELINLLKEKSNQSFLSELDEFGNGIRIGRNRSETPTSTIKEESGKTVK